MSNRNQSNQTGKNNTQHLGSPFAGLTFEDGKIGLPVSDTAAEKSTPAPAPTPVPTLKPVVRRTMSLPRRGSNSRLFTNRTGDQPAGNITTNETPTPAAVVATTAQEQPVLEVAAPLPVAPTIQTQAITGWELLEQHERSGKPIAGRVIRVVRSRTDVNAIIGIKVRVAGLEGFAPFRMLGLSPLETEHSVTLEMSFRVIELGRGKDNGKDRIILNHQVVKAEEKTAALIKTVKIGDTVEGIIRKVANFGAFLDIDGASALIRVNDLPRGSTASVKVGERVNAVIVKRDATQNQLGASIKHFAVSQLSVGAEFTGPVKNVESFGVFVQLNDTIDGLVHISQFGDFQPVKGDLATVKVLSIKAEQGQVQLALLNVQAASAGE